MRFKRGWRAALRICKCLFKDIRAEKKKDSRRASRHAYKQQRLRVAAVGELFTASFTTGLTASFTTSFTACLARRRATPLSSISKAPLARSPAHCSIRAMILVLSGEAQRERDEAEPRQRRFFLLLFFFVVTDEALRHPSMRSNSSKVRQNL